MLLSNNVEIKNSAIDANLQKIINQTYKLLPNREENIDWQTPLSTIIEELAGMSRLLDSQHENLFSVLCKLEGLYLLTKEEDFFLYRRTIFECLNIMSLIRKGVVACQD